MFLINQITDSSFYFLDGHFNKNENSKKFYDQQINLYASKRNEIEDLKSEKNQNINSNNSLNGENNILTQIKKDEELEKKKENFFNMKSK